MEDPGFFAGLFAGMAAWFVFGSVTFWLILGSTAAALLWMTESHKDFLAAVVVVLAAWFFLSANDVSIWGDPAQLLKWAGIYLVIGAAWSFFKWLSFLFSMKDRLKYLKASFVEASRVTLVDGKIPTSHVPGFLEHVQRNGYRPNPDLSLRSMNDLIPTVASRADDLARWIAWWPLSAFWTILNDPLRRLGEWIVRVLNNVYTRLATAVFRSEI